MIFVGALHNYCLSDSAKSKIPTVVYEGRKYALNSLEEARRESYKGGAGVLFWLGGNVTLGDGEKQEIKRCPVCGRLPILRRYHRRSRLICLGFGEREGHEWINRFGFGSNSSFKKAILDWNRKCGEYRADFGKEDGGGLDGKDKKRRWKPW